MPPVTPNGPSADLQAGKLPRRELMVFFKLPPLSNLLITLAGSFVLFVSLTFHPSLVLMLIGAAVSLIGVTVRFERRKRARR
jgi:hypothetical protein